MGTCDAWNIASLVLIEMKCGTAVGASNFIIHSPVFMGLGYIITALFVCFPENFKS